MCGAVSDARIEKYVKVVLKQTLGPTTLFEYDFWKVFMGLTSMMMLMRMVFMIKKGFGLQENQRKKVYCHRPFPMQPKDKQDSQT